MSKELVEVSDSVVSLGKNAIKDMKEQRKMLTTFVKSQLVEANFEDTGAKNFGEGDYGVIPGTKRLCLLKPGAEKLLRLFALGARFKVIDKEIDRHANFAMFTYEAEIYLLRSGIAIATCQATANSQEVKYKERKVWRTQKLPNGKEVREQVHEETPIFDVLNTLQKMAQKRALVGAVILATGASEYFTTDVIDGDEYLSAKARDVSESAKGAPFSRPAAQAPSEEKSEPIITNIPAEPEVPVCCGKKMMISKYVDQNTGIAPWYCMQCKSKIAPNEAAS